MAYTLYVQVYFLTVFDFWFRYFFVLASTEMKLDFFFCRIFLYVLLQSDGFVPFIVHYVIHIKINHFIVIDHQFIIKNVISIVVLVSPFSVELKIIKKKKLGHCCLGHRVVIMVILFNSTMDIAGKVLL